MKHTLKSTRPSRPEITAGELTLIAALRERRQTTTPELRLGMGDDCALLRPAVGEELAITTDLSLENVHFRRNLHSPEAVGHRCLARGLSDLAAMGARPVAAFLSLALPAELTIASRGRRSWADRFLDGLLALAGRLDLPLAGGDTAQSPATSGAALVAADIVLVGGVKRKRALLRSGAAAGDGIYVSGALGGAAAELLALRRDPSRFARLRVASAGHPHLYPEPRIETGLRLARRRLATAAIDLSDGLSTDLSHLCEESGLDATIEAAAIPVHPMARLAEAAGWAPSALDLALHGGEDYELLFTASAKEKLPSKIAGIPIRRIGSMVAKGAEPGEVWIRQAGGSPVIMPARGWQHFRR